MAQNTVKAVLLTIILAVAINSDSTGFYISNYYC